MSYANFRSSFRIPSTNIHICIHKDQQNISPLGCEASSSFNNSSCCLANDRTDATWLASVSFEVHTAHHLCATVDRTAVDHKAPAAAGDEGALRLRTTSRELTFWPGLPFSGFL